MKRFNPILITLILVVVTLIPVMGMDGHGEKIDNFFNISSELEEYVTLRGQNTRTYDNHAYFEIEKNVPVSKAEFKVSTVDTDTGPWIRDPGIDIGIDGENDWEYSGKGYGDFGRLQVYSDDSTSKTTIFKGSQQKVVGSINLPEGSDVNMARMELMGRFIPTDMQLDVIGNPYGISYTPQDVEFGDLNGNGIPDAVVSTGSPGSLYIYVQKEKGSFYPERISEASGVYDYLLMDVDQDDDLDLLYSHSSGISWLENDGEGDLSSSTLIDSNFSPWFMRKIDADGDDDHEVICSMAAFQASTSPIKLLKRSSGSTFQLWPLYNTSNSYTSNQVGFMKVGDYNADGYPDVYSAFSDRVVRIYENPGYEWYYDDTTNISSKDLWNLNEVLTSTYSINGFDVGDMDSDGRSDVVIAPDDTYSAQIEYHRNNGASTWSKYNILPSTVYRPQSVSMLDMDNDGDLDVFYSVGYSSSNHRIGWLDAPSNPNQNSWSNNYIHTGYSRTGDRAFVYDVDSDGIQDAGLFFTASRQSIIYYGDSSEVHYGFLESAANPSGMRDLVEVDMDGDRDDDFLTTAYSSGQVGWFENDGTPYKDDWIFHPLNLDPISGANEVDYGDIDGDGDMDVAVTSYSQHYVYWLENVGGPKMLWKSYNVGRMYYAQGVGVEDFDGDGDAEIVASAGYYYNYGVRLYYSNNPKSSFSVKTLTSATYCGVINITDMNLDGHPDILVTINGYSGQAVIYRNPLYSQSSILSSWTAITAIGGLSYSHECRPIDIDNDGNLDVVATSNYGSYDVLWGHCPSNRNATSGWNSYGLISGKITYPYGLNVADMDDDGYADVFVSSHYWWGYYYGSGLYWLEEDDDPFGRWEFHAMDTGTDHTWGIAKSDLNEDGTREIFVISNDEDRLFASKPELNYASNIGLDFDSDGTNEWEYTGVLKGVEELEFAEELKSIVDDTTGGSVDSWGNRIITLPITMNTGNDGKISAYDLEIRYNTTVKIDDNGRIKNVVDKIIPEYDDGTGSRTRVYIGFNGYISDGVEARALLWDLDVQYNAPPELTQPLPQRLSVPEDGIKTRALDLSKYFKDDYDSPRMLDYEVKGVGPNSNKVDLYIENGANLTIDSRITKNYYGTLEAYFIITDNGGPGGTPPRSYTTEPIIIEVKPTRDDPERGRDSLPEKIFGKEGKTVEALDLSELELFTDPDDPYGFSIRYETVIDPLDNYPDESISNRPEDSLVNAYVSNKIIMISAEGDWYGDNIPLRLYGYDDDSLDVNTDPFWDTFIDIENENDGPVWEEIPTIYLDEDSSAEAVIDFVQYVSDIDTAPLSLNFRIVDYTNSNAIKVQLNDEDQGKLDISTTMENWNGLSTVSIEVSDGELTDMTTFDIVVEPVNDLPTVTISKPVEGKRILEGEFSVTGKAFDEEGIQDVSVLFEGKWYTASGKGAWGVTISMTRDYQQVDYDVPILVKVTDIHGANSTDTVNIDIEPRKVYAPDDTDGDGYPDSVDDFDDDPSEWLDSDFDGVGDNEDAFPNNKVWRYDSDLDGIADVADDHPFDPDPGSGVVAEDDEESESGGILGLVLLWILVFLVLVFSAIIGYSFYDKRRSSRDPILSVKYEKKIERRREKIAKVLGKAHLERLLTKSQLKDVDLSKGKGKTMMAAPVISGGLGDQQRAMPSMPNRANLPPAQHQYNGGQGRPIPTQQRGGFPPRNE